MPLSGLLMLDQWFLLFFGIQELARSTEERELAVDRLQQAHVALQQQKEELSCLQREKDQLVAQTEECQLLAKEYQKQLVAQEATLVQLKQAGVSERKDTEYKPTMMRNSGNGYLRTDGDMPSKANNGSVVSREMSVPCQLISDNQTQLYTLQQEVDSLAHIPSNSNELSPKNTLACPLYDSMTMLHGENTSASMPISSAKAIRKSHRETSSSNDIRKSTSETSSGKVCSKSVSDVGVGTSDLQELCHMKHKATQTRPQMTGRGCQTTPSAGDKHVCDCEPGNKTVHQSLQLTGSVHTATSASVGVQTERCLHVYDGHETEESLSSFMCGGQVGEQENGSENSKFFPVVCKRNTSISLSLLELIDDLELRNTNNYAKESNSLLSVDSEHENTVLSDIFFLS